MPTVTLRLWSDSKKDFRSQGAFACDHETLQLPATLDIRKSDYHPLETGGEEFRLELTDPRYAEVNKKLGQHLHERGKMLNHAASGVQVLRIEMGSPVALVLRRNPAGPGTDGASHDGAAAGNGSPAVKREREGDEGGDSPAKAPKADAAAGANAMVVDEAADPPEVAAAAAAAAAAPTMQAMVAAAGESTSHTEAPTGYMREIVMHENDQALAAAMSAAPPPFSSDRNYTLERPTAADMAPPPPAPQAVQVEVVWPKDPGPGTLGRSLRGVRTNFRKLEVGPGVTVYQYDVHIGSIKEIKKADSRRALMRRVGAQLKQMLPANHGWAYDGDKILYFPGSFRTRAPLPAAACSSLSAFPAWQVHHGQAGRDHARPGGHQGGRGHQEPRDCAAAPEHRDAGVRQPREPPAADRAPQGDGGDRHCDALARGEQGGHRAGRRRVLRRAAKSGVGERAAHRA
jgi:hypothetical protein